MPKPSLYDRVRAYFNPDYAAQAAGRRAQAAVYDEWASNPRRYLNSARRGGDNTRTDVGWSSQPWGPLGTRTLTPTQRREMVKRARQIDEGNILGSSLLDRAVDNIIGEQMIIQARTSNKAFNKNVEAKWKEYEADVQGLDGMPELQQLWYRTFTRDGDIALLLLDNGQVQTIESDYIISPSLGSTDDYNRKGAPKIVEGVEIDGVGRPVKFHIATEGQGYRVTTTPVDAKNVVFVSRRNRKNRTSVRGVPVLAELGWMLEQIDGTIEAVVMAYRMSAMFGLLIKKEQPSKTFSALPTTVTNAAGNAQAEFQMEPAMVHFLKENEGIEQVRPEHPTTSFDGFMTFLIRMAGVKLGLPLELALLDFSRTNYSSARASMEQAYRRFRIEQRQFGAGILSKVYRWRVQKWIDDGELGVRIPSDPFAHVVYGQEWPYLDPQKEAVGTLVAIDAGMTTLTHELAKRGKDFNDWIEERSAELKALDEAEIPLVRSTSTRDPNTAAQPQDMTNGNQDTPDDNADDAVSTEG